ncbi:MAG TPA: cupredoxin domain-containing protein [Candidatus Sulfotelmatobacter sp.]|jgi:hypothetical protein|nr:cupredoxin domain-containing protein [Candidatus Sulfotelmatobacter sp.]
MPIRRLSPAVLGLSLLALPALAPFSAAQADEPGVYRLTIKDHRFTPDSISIPADTKVTVIVSNQDATPEEFDSIPLRREKVVPAGKEVTILLGPLKPGTYAFIGEYHEDTAKGTVVVQPKE